jgi:glutamate/aspartate transport system substrate-binding protein
MPYGFMTRHDDLQFHDAVNDALHDIYASGEAEAIYNRWFTSPIPPRGVNLNVPLSDTMKLLFAHPQDIAD